MKTTILISLLLLSKIALCNTISLNNFLEGFTEIHNDTEGFPCQENAIAEIINLEHKAQTFFADRTLYINQRLDKDGNFEYYYSTNWYEADYDEYIWVFSSSVTLNERCEVTNSTAYNV